LKFSYQTQIFAIATDLFLSFFSCTNRRGINSRIEKDKERNRDSSKNAESRERMLNTRDTLYTLRPWRRVVHEACLARSSSCATFAIRAPCPVASLRCALVIQLVSSANSGKMHVDYAYEKSTNTSFDWVDHFRNIPLPIILFRGTRIRIILRNFIHVCVREGFYSQSFLITWNGCILMLSDFIFPYGT